MVKVGLTGNIAAGKSTVARIWTELGAIVIEADDLARRVVAPGTEALRQIVGVWGEGVLDATGGLDRAVLRDIVFRDDVARERLESIVHPAIRELRDREYDRARESGASLVVADIPLLFELGMVDEFDVVVLVDSPSDARLERLVRMRGLAPEEARRMIEAQMPSEVKWARADYVIPNHGSLSELESGATEVWRRLEELAGQTQGSE